MKPAIVRALWCLALPLVACSRSDTKAASPGGTSATGTVEVGAPAPSYQAASLTGAPVSLADYRGKVVLLNAWATWCGPCRGEIPELRAIDSRYRAKGLNLIGVTIDAAGMDAQIAAFVKQFRMEYILWHDPGEQVLTRFAIVGLPATFLIDRNGIVQWKTTGPVAPGDSSLDAAIRATLAK